MKSILAVLLSLMLLQAKSASAQEVNCALVKEAFFISESIRGLTRKSSVPCFVKTKEAVEAELRGMIETKVPREKIEGEALLYKLLTIIPANYPYQQKMVELYLSQLGGYYDPQKGHYVMAGWIPGALQMTVAVHELTHALQNQYFNLNSLLDVKKLSTDMQLAYSALIEGDATAVMTDYQRQLIGTPGISQEKSVDSMILQTIMSTGILPGSQEFPPLIRHQLIFPYTSGLRFVHYFLQHKKSYKVVDDLFKNLPHTTAEILHPELYPLKVVDLKSDIKSDAGKKIIYSDSLGEFFLAAWLGQLSKNELKGSQIAAGWRGDLAEVFQDVNTTDPKSYSLQWKILFKDEEGVKSFMEFTKTLPLSFERRDGKMVVVKNLLKVE